VVISNGGDNHSRYGVAAVRRYLLKAGVEVYAVNIMTDFPQPTWTADGPLLLAGICWARSSESVEGIPSARDGPSIRLVAPRPLYYEPRD